MTCEKEIKLHTHTTRTREREREGERETPTEKCLFINTWCGDGTSSWDILCVCSRMFGIQVSEVSSRQKWFISLSREKYKSQNQKWWETGNRTVVVHLFCAVSNKDNNYSVWSLSAVCAFAQWYNCLATTTRLCWCSIQNQYHIQVAHSKHIHDIIHGRRMWTVCGNLFVVLVWAAWAVVECFLALARANDESK